MVGVDDDDDDTDADMLDGWMDEWTDGRMGV